MLERHAWGGDLKQTVGLPRTDPDVQWILHVSDLHGGLAGARSRIASIVESLKAYDIPLVLVTGDLANHPNDKCASAGIRMIEDLRPVGCARSVEVRVVLGNHDRFQYGNRAPWWLSWTPGSRKGSSVVEEVAQKYLSSPKEAPFDFNGISVGVLGLDSSVGKNGAFLAMGWANFDPMTLRTQAENLEADLVVAMVHHHPLKIREAEAAGLLHQAMDAASTMANSAQLLRTACGSSINVILHGHNHKNFVARYEEPDHGEVFVLGAGSATGAHHSGGTSLERQQFNLISIRADGRVVAHPIEYDATSENWCHRSIEILASGHLDSERYHRAKRLIPVGESGRPFGTKEVSYEISHEGDAYVVSRRTEVPDGTLEITFRLCCASPDRFRAWKMVIRSTGGGTIQQIEENQLSVTSDQAPTGWVVVTAELPQGRGLMDVELHYGLDDAFALTRAEQDLWRHRGGCVSDEAWPPDTEAIGLTAERPYTLVKTSIIFLTGAPNAATAISSSSGPVDGWRKRAYANSLGSVGTSVVTAEVPFPAPGHTYSVVWTLPGEPLESIRHECVRLLARADEMRKAMPSGRLEVTVAILEWGTDAPGNTEPCFKVPWSEETWPAAASMGKARDDDLIASWRTRSPMLTEPSENLHGTNRLVVPITLPEPEGVDGGDAATESLKPPVGCVIVSDPENFHSDLSKFYLEASSIAHATISEVVRLAIR